MDCHILQTERMRIRQFRETDFEVFFAMESNDLVMRYINGRGRSLAEARERFNRYLSDYTLDPGFGAWAVCLADDPAPIGTSCLNYIDHTSIRQIGYKFSPEQHGKGLATELAQGLLQYAFECCSLPEVSAVCDPENKASEKVMQKNGMEYIGRGQFFGTECLHYRIDSGKWFQKKAQNLSFTANPKSA